MLRLHRYLLGELVRPLAASLLFLFQLLFAMQLLRGTDVLFGSAVHAGDVLHIALLLAPHFLVMALPIAFLVAVLLGLGRLAEDRELLALSAAGVSPRVLLPVPLAIAGVLALIGLLLGRGPEPRGLAGVRDYAGEMIKRNLQGDVKPGVFFEDLTHLTLYAEGVDPESFAWSNVLVHDDRDPKAPLLVLARSGRLEIGAGSAVALRLADGQVHRAAGNAADYSLMRFERGVIEVGLGDSFFRRNSFRSAKEELTEGELLDAARRARDEGRPDAAVLWTALERRHATPLAPLAFALVAVPLGASLRRGARAAGFGLAGLSFALYYVLARLGQQWAEAGRVGPILGAQFANLCFAALGLLLLWATRNRA
jgi:lipopolysaccharide export system permease protein